MNIKLKESIIYKILIKYLLNIKYILYNTNRKITLI